MKNSIPILSVAQMRSWEEASWREGVSEESVIANVGKSIALWIAQNRDRGSQILLLAGKGNNGADVRAVRGYLNPEDYDIKLVNIHDPSEGMNELFTQLGISASHEISEDSEENSDILIEYLKWYPDLIVDGLFGIGLSRSLDKNWVSLIELVNEIPGDKLSIDCPSGLNCDSGEPHPVAIEATWTITIGAPKIGLIKDHASQWTGRLMLSHKIGLSENGLEDIPNHSEGQKNLRWLTNELFTDQIGELMRPVSGHKGTFGHLLIIAGSPGYQGAAVLSAKAAQTRQPGLISVLTIGQAFVPVASQLAGPMVHEFNSDVLEALLEKASAILIGPGLASFESRNYLYPIVQKIWQESNVPVVVDASALDWIPDGPIESDARRVITPHAGEAKRLLGRIEGCEGIDSMSREEITTRLSESYGSCSVVLKGYLTQVSFNEEIYLNPTGNPYLSQGGSGDVLAGLISGSLAYPLNEFEAEDKNSIEEDQILKSVWLHGAAADTLQMEGLTWTVEDLVQKLKVPAPYQNLISPD